jgi:ABC-2 type transport system ATP-binding protein
MSIIVNQLSYDYPGKRALENVSFTIEDNTITALVGPNGAGKTTLMRAMAALTSPMTGTIKMDEWDVDRHPRNVHNICSYLSDFFGLYDQLTVEQCLTFFALSHDISTNLSSLIQQTAKQLQIENLLQTKAGKLSRGLRQRLAIAQVIIHHPKILLLDEPAAGLDPSARYHLSELLRTLQKSGMTIVVSSHILAELEDYCTHMLVIDNGKLVKHCSLNEINNAEKIQIRIELTEPAEKHIQTIQAIPGITLLTTTQNELIVTLESTVLSQALLLKTLIAKAIPVSSIHTQKQKMQDVYMDATQNKSKDKDR